MCCQVFPPDNRKDFQSLRQVETPDATGIRRLVEMDGRTDLLGKLRYTDRNQKFKLWQDRFDDLAIRSMKVLENKLQYIHYNPMQEHWNLVSSPELYSYSSAGFYEHGLQNDLEVIHYKEFF